MAKYGITIYKNLAPEGSLSSGSPTLEAGSFTESFEGRFGVDPDRDSMAKVTRNIASGSVRYLMNYDNPLPNVSHVYVHWADYNGVDGQYLVEPWNSTVNDRDLSGDGLINGGTFVVRTGDRYTMSPSEEEGQALAEIHPNYALSGVQAGFMFYSDGTPGWTDSTVTIGFKNLMWLSELDIIAPLYTVERSYTTEGKKQTRTLGGKLVTSTYGAVKRATLSIQFESVDETTKLALEDLYTTMQGDTHPFVITHDEGLTIGTSGPDAIEGLYVVKFADTLTITETHEKLYDISFEVKEI